MKGNRINVFWLSAILSLQVFVSNAQSDVIGLIKETIKVGSAKELSKYLNQTVEVTIDDKEQPYSKSQAEFVLRDFFKQHPPSEFDIIHQGSSPAGKPYAIGRYTSGDEVFRIFLITKTVNNQQLLSEIKFAKF